MALEVEYLNSFKCALVVFFCGSLGLRFSIFKMESPFSIRHLFVEFSHQTIFCKSHRYSKHGKMLSCSKLIIVDLTLPLDIDNRKPTTDSNFNESIELL